MLKSEILNSTGIIVGRFQVYSLTQGHKDLIDLVISKNKYVIIILGYNDNGPTKNNPLSIETRIHMINSEYPDINILSIKDECNDNAWVKNLDEIIKYNTVPGTIPMLYGSRDSFINVYIKNKGVYQCSIIPPKTFISGKEIRAGINYAKTNTLDFRKGVIWATQNQYDKTFNTVDIVPYKLNFYGKIDKILLANKNEDLGKLRIIGGFVQPDNNDIDGFLEGNAKRELLEETHSNLKNIKYLGSYLINDWRYANEKDKIFTALFIGEIGNGIPTPDDDIDRLEWVSVNDLNSRNYTEINIAKLHQELIYRVLKYIKGYNGRFYEK